MACTFAVKVMLADVAGSQYSGSVMVMLLLFANTVVMTYTFPITNRGCICGKGSGQMFIIVPLIAIRYWLDLRVVMIEYFDSGQALERDGDALTIYFHRVECSTYVQAGRILKNFLAV
jgi:hypothetical protein